jgi:hypothetical protein
MTYDIFLEMLDLLYNAGFEPHEEISQKFDPTGNLIKNTKVAKPQVSNGDYAMNLQIKNRENENVRARFHFVILASQNRIIVYPVMVRNGEYQYIRYNGKLDIEAFKKWIRVITLDLKLGRSL